jgi:hypothetical protein
MEAILTPADALQGATAARRPRLALQVEAGWIPRDRPQCRTHRSALVPQSEFRSRSPGVVKALAELPDDSVIDGEVVAFDECGKPSFDLLQGLGSGVGR